MNNSDLTGLAGLLELILDMIWRAVERAATALLGEA